MIANNNLRVAETDFDSIKQNLKTFLRSQAEFQDYDFDGAGLSVLLDILAYNTHYMAYYLNMIANESFLDTAQLRSSVVSHAKAINYVPESRHGAMTRVNLLVTPTNTESSNSIVTLNRYTKLLGTDIDGINYPFVTLYSNTAAKSNGAFQFNNIQIKQGEVVTLQYLMEVNHVKRRFRIASPNVDIDTLSVVVQQSQTNTDASEYTLATDITVLDGTSKVYFVEEDTDGTYVVYFGDDVIGKKPPIGSVIIITYIDTVGSAANKIRNFSFSERIGGLFADNVIVTAANSSFGGSEREAIEDIRYRAPYSYVTQNRAVTMQDYETLLIKDFADIESVSVWGGEDNDPPVYGKVFMSLKTKNNSFLTNVEKEAIKDTLIRTRNVLTVIPEIVDPSYTYLLIRGKVLYNSKVTASTADNIKALVRAAIFDYHDDELTTFNSTFRKSKLQSYIEESESAITGSDVRFLMQKRVNLTPNQTKNYTIDFGTTISKGDLSYGIFSYPSITVLDKTLNSRKVFFEEAPSIDSGISGFRIVNGGINYSSPPTVTIAGDGSGATARAQVSGGKLVAIEIIDKGTNYTRATVTLSGEVGNGAEVEAILENRNGRIRSYYIKNTGEKVIVDANAGTIDYLNGTIVLTSLNVFGITSNDYYETNVLTFNVPIESEIVTPLKNRILEIDADDPLSVQIEVIPE